MSLRKRVAMAIAMGAGGVSVMIASAAAPVSARTTASQTPKDTLVVAMDGAVDTFDPAFEVGSAPVQTVIQNIFDQLTMYKLAPEKLPTGQSIQVSKTTDVIGMLAQSYSVSKDGKTVTFHIRKGLTYQNGDPVNAFTIKKGAYDRTFESQGIAGFLLSMAGVSKESQVQAPDAYTLVVHLSKANPLFLQNDTMLNTAALDPKEIAQNATKSDPWAKAFFQKNLGVGNGPFGLESYTAGSQIVLKANPKYWAGATKLKKVIVLFAPDATQRVQMLESGTVDMVQDPPLSDLQSLQKAPGVSVYSVPSTRVQMLELNTKQKPFNNVLVRRAIAYAVPYQDLIKNVMHGFATPATSLVPTGMPTHDGSYWTYNTNLKKASALLAQAGYPNGKGLPPVTITVRAGTAEAEQDAVFIQANLQQLGVNVQIQQLSYATYNQLEQGGKLQLWVDDWISWVNDPFYHLSWIVDSTSPSNYTHYKNATVDQLISKYTLAPNNAARTKASDQVQKMLAQDVPLIYLYQPNFNVAMRSNVKGYVYTNDQLFRFYYMNKK